MQHKRSKKYKYSRSGASQSQKLPPTDGPPTLGLGKQKNMGGTLRPNDTPKSLGPWTKIELQFVGVEYSIAIIIQIWFDLTRFIYNYDTVLL